MIALTRLNGARFVLNADLIRTIEHSPDTLITLVSGEHLMVREEIGEVVRKTIEYGRLLRRAAPPDPAFEGAGGGGTSAAFLADDQARPAPDRM